ncbi:hypothetical protein [Candidatus Rhabdochlamydia oedothoracis]|uniref:hypothetical protein n=1 Tax=Candidatus Rhabdochlamydia oedothoracis TaxID=2720720 RepID=UPI001C653FF4|nr:hypothetical protein [Candidatus Rhabdochlamydia oedothoracis]
MVGITNSAVDPNRNCVAVPIPRKGEITKLFGGAVVPATVPKAADPLQSKVLIPRKLLEFPKVKEVKFEEAEIFIAFVIVTILHSLFTYYLRYLVPKCDGNFKTFWFFLPIFLAVRRWP